MATIRDIAKEAGVSVGTASRALTGNGYVASDKKELVLETAKKLGYEVKAKRTFKKTKTVGIMLLDISFPFYSSFLKYAEVELAERGYKTIVCNALGVQNRVSEMIGMLENHELDGLIINADVTKSEQARLEKLPVVSFERLLGNKIPMVASEHRSGGRIVGNLFIQSNCKNVLILTAKHMNKVYADYRIEECEKLLSENGIKVTIVEVDSMMLSYRIGKEFVADYMNLYTMVDGIFADDITAYFCVFEALKRGKRIPDDIKIIGYDGIELTKMITPNITTIAQDIPKIAFTCVDTLMRVIDNEKVENEILLPVSLQSGGTI